MSDEAESPKSPTATTGESQNTITVIKTNEADDVKLEVNVANAVDTVKSQGETTIAISIGKDQKPDEMVKMEVNGDASASGEQKTVEEEDKNTKEKEDEEEEEEIPPIHPLTDQEIEDIISKHAKMEEKDKKKYLDFFWDIDQERYGKFTIHQLAYKLRSSGKLLTDSVVARIFTDLDHDNDMLVSLGEYLDEMSKPSIKKMSEDDYKMWFTKFDQDKDGFVSRSDIQTTMQEAGSYMLPTDLMQLMCHDKSGLSEKLDLEEFSRALKKQLK